MLNYVKLLKNTYVNFLFFFFLLIIYKYYTLLWEEILWDGKPSMLWYLFLDFMNIYYVSEAIRWNLHFIQSI